MSINPTVVANFNELGWRVYSHQEAVEILMGEDSLDKTELQEWFDGMNSFEDPLIFGVGDRAVGKDDYVLIHHAHGLGRECRGAEEVSLFLDCIKEK